MYRPNNDIAGDGVAPRLCADGDLPPEAPLAMPVQDLRRSPVHAVAKPNVARGQLLQRRLFLRAVLSAYAGRSADELMFTSGAFGKPRLHDGDGLCFSLSRSGERVLLGVARGLELGVDVERRDPRLDDPEELSRAGC